MKWESAKRSLRRGGPFHRRWQWHPVARREGWPQRIGQRRRQAARNARRRDRCPCGNLSSDSSASPRSGEQSDELSGLRGPPPPNRNAEANQATSVAMCEFGVSPGLGVLSVASQQPSGEGCVDGELHAAHKSRPLAMTSMRRSSCREGTTLSSRTSQEVATVPSLPAHTRRSSLEGASTRAQHA